MSNNKNHLFSGFYGVYLRNMLMLLFQKLVHFRHGNLARRDGKCKSDDNADKSKKVE